jgi:excinuclease ABC subunit C
MAAVAEPAGAPAEEATEAATEEVVTEVTEQAGQELVVESTTAPAGPAERGTPAPGAGATAEVGRVAS